MPAFSRCLTWAVIATSALGACTKKSQQEEAPKEEAPPSEVRGLSRADFNHLALESALPLFWAEDKDNDGALDASELAVVWGMDDTSWSTWVKASAFTPRFEEAYSRLQKAAQAKNTPQGQVAARVAALQKELSQSYFTLVESDFSTASPEERTVVEDVMKAAKVIERIYAKQLGTWGMQNKIPKDDGLSKLVYFMHQSPWCSGPTTENDPNCTALPLRPDKVSGLYPASLQTDKGFCDTLRKRPDSETLLSPFTVVVEKEGKLTAVPYNEFYKSDMQEVSAALKAAAAAIGDEHEAALKAYLLAAAQAFIDNQWFVADEAWAKMNAENSKWYLRIGPDEVYYEPCSQKAGFHVSFARINPGSVEWQKKLEPVKAEMETVLAAHTGKPYKAREVAFHLPDFIDVVLNAGDSRDARGATIGQSLPNWGPVANEGRGRTVAMTNFYTDADSRETLRKQSESMLCRDAMQKFVDAPEPQVMSTVLHEAGHNLGPSHEYKVRGKTDDQIFGGPIASVMEELKAQTIALFMTDWLVQKNIITRELADQAHLRDIIWAMGHISRGMYDSEGKPKTYSQLAAIQVGFLMHEGALSWRPEKSAAGQDEGCLAVDYEKLPAAIDKLTTGVLGIKGRGDLAGAHKLIANFVDSKDDYAKVRSAIAERWQRFPRASFLYAVKL